MYAIGQIDMENVDEHIVEIPGKGYIITVPYLYERNIPEGFFQQLLDRVAERNMEGLPVVMTAHTTVRGCDFTGHDHASELSVGSTPLPVSLDESYSHSVSMVEIAELIEENVPYQRTIDLMEMIVETFQNPRKARATGTAQTRYSPYCQTVTSTSIPRSQRP